MKPMAMHGNNDIIINSSSHHLESELNICKNEYIMVAHLIAISIGIPLNLGVIALIIGLKRLHLHGMHLYLARRRARQRPYAAFIFA